VLTLLEVELHAGQHAGHHGEQQLEASLSCCFGGFKVQDIYSSSAAAAAGAAIAAVVVGTMARSAVTW
jgi:hypothetical protein